MRVLAIHSAYHPDQNKRSAVDAWRLARPLRELRKVRPDWQIDERPTVIPEIESYKDGKEFSEIEMEQAYRDLASYDIILSTYQSNPTIYTLLKVAEKRDNVQYIMDVDDDMFAINPDNPVWMAVNDENIYHMQCMIRDNTWLTTTTETLAKELRKRRKGHHKNTVLVNPNYIPDDYQHPKIDNGDKIVIGFFGGSSHYGDLHRTGVLEAVQKLMHENKNIYFKSVGMVVDTYLPKARVIIGDAKKGDAWINEIYPSLNLDIALGPLEKNLFNESKSDIKWQEATRAGSLFVASNVGPYAKLLPGTAITCQNNQESWYKALKKAVESVALRQKVVKEAQIVLQDQYRLEDHAEDYAKMLETVYETAKKPAYATI